MSPNYAQRYYASAFTAMLTGDGSTTLSATETALQLSPLDPLL